MENSIRPPYIEIKWQDGEFTDFESQNGVTVFDLMYIAKNRLHELGVDDKRILEAIDTTKDLLLLKRL